MKRNYLIILFFALIFTACKENFHVWKDKNEEFLQTSRKDYGLELDPTTEAFYRKINFTGFGPRPNRNSLVIIQYKAVLADGSSFTSIDTMGYVINYPVGLQNALLQMNRESVWQICLPHEQGYGKSGTKDIYGVYEVPPFTTLFFKELKLVEVVQE